MHNCGLWNLVYLGYGENETLEVGMYCTELSKETPYLCMNNIFFAVTLLSIKFFREMVTFENSSPLGCVCMELT